MLTITIRCQITLIDNLNYYFRVFEFYQWMWKCYYEVLNYCNWLFKLLLTSVKLLGANVVHNHYYINAYLQLSWTATKDLTTVA